MALQFLVHGARACKEPGILVAFEETSGRILAMADCVVILTHDVVKGVSQGRMRMRELRGSDAAKPGRHETDVVNVFEQPERALADGFFMTPTLLKLSPSPPRRIIGTLHPTLPVLLALGLGPLPE